MFLVNLLIWEDVAINETNYFPKKLNDCGCHTQSSNLRLINERLTNAKIGPVLISLKSKRNSNNETGK